MLDTPILLILFNRPDHARRVLEQVRQQQPSVLYVAQDGPRHHADEQKIMEVRQMVETLVDWPCELHTLYQKKNLGCGPGPMTAISWFFSENEMGIILEDDAVPCQQFFSYARELLVRYQSDTTVRAIASMNVDTQQWGDGSYYFSMMNRNLCAWATWRRAWQDFDINVSGVSPLRLRRILRRYGCTALEREYWSDRLHEVHKNCCNGASWDMQFFMSIWLHGGKGIIPNVNLSSNIGTTADATHVMQEGNIIDNVPTADILPLIHPTDTTIQQAADRIFHQRYFEPDKKGWPWYLTIYNILNRRLKRLTGHQGKWIKRNR